MSIQKGRGRPQLNPGETMGPLTIRVSWKARFALELIARQEQTSISRIAERFIAAGAHATLFEGRGKNWKTMLARDETITARERAILLSASPEEEYFAHVFHFVLSALPRTTAPAEFVNSEAGSELWEVARTAFARKPRPDASAVADSWVTERIPKRPRRKSPKRD